jgi:hypothetical protein
MLRALYDKAIDPKDFSREQPGSLLREEFILMEAERRLSKEASVMYAIQGLSPDIQSDSRMKLLKMAMDQFMQETQPWILTSTTVGTPDKPQPLKLDLSDPASVERYYHAHVEHAKKVRESRKDG